MNTTILSGLKVVEVCSLVAGPYCGKLLADMGADVIKVEPPLGGDPARRQGPFKDGRPNEDGSVLFLHLNTSKRSIQLDHTNPLGLEILQSLVADADVLLEDNAPEISKRLGIRHQDLEASNPNLVVTSVTPFGQTGPHNGHKAYPLNTFHSGGEGYLTPLGNPLSVDGLLDRPPTKQGRFVGEYEIGMLAAIPTLAAVFHSRAGGGGQQVDLSKQEALIGLNYLEMAFWLIGGPVPTRTTRMMDIGGIMACKDGFVEFCLHEEHQWKGLVKMLGDPPWAGEEWAQTPATRVQHSDEINAHLRKWLPKYTKAQVMELGQQAGTTVAQYNEIPEVVDSEQMRVRNYFADVAHPIIGTHKYPTSAYRFDGKPLSLRHAPLLGQHNEEIYCGIMGFSLEELAQMRELGVI